MAALPGGWIADRLIGQRRAVLDGGIIIAARPFQHGHPLAADVLSRPHADRRRHRPAERQRQRHRRAALRARGQRRDAGFSIFYMGINLGAFLAPLVCGYLGQRVSWHVGFAAAGVGMTLGVIQYALSSQRSRRGRSAPGGGNVDRGRGVVAPGASVGRPGLGAALVLGIGGTPGPCRLPPSASPTQPACCCFSAPWCSSAGCSSPATGRGRNAAAST